MNIGDQINEVFSRHAHRPVISQGRRTLTFDNVASQTDNFLARLPCELNGLIGIWGDNSTASLTMIIAALRAGLPWISLSPTFPAERIAGVLTQLPISFVLITRAALNCRPDLARAKRSGVALLILEGEDLYSPLVLKGGGGSMGISPPALPPSTYCVFTTSGSTGRPKYVPLSHENVGCFVENLHRSHDHGRRLSLLHPTSSSASLQNILIALTSGAALCMPDNYNFLSFGKFLGEANVDTVHIGPSTIRLLTKLGQLQPAGLSFVRTTFIGGEIVRKVALDQWIRAAIHSKVYNSYGPTEATVNISFHRCEGNRSEKWTSEIAPIGTPFHRHQAVVVDEALEPVGAGCSGELILSGPQIAPGYLGSPAEMISRFVTRPLIAGNEHWYRTGDLAVQDPQTGLFTVIGRIDREIKIAGYRVHPSEIEAAIREADRTADIEAAVIALEDGSGFVQRVVGFVEGSATPPPELLARCKKLLPYYMLPTEIRPVSSLPMSPSGKVDYAALKAFASQG